MRVPTLTPGAYRRITLVAGLALAFIIVTGGAVRLTGSGLGCPDWPTCDKGRLVAPSELRPMVEFINRTITGIVSVAVILAVLGSFLRRPRRRDLLWLSVGLVAGVIGQIVLGGMTVLFELKPGFVMSHFLLSMVILADAVVLHHRAGAPDGGRPRTAVPPGLRPLRMLLVGAASLVIVLGTVVTSSGPHGGDERAPRFDLSLHAVAQAHGAAVVMFLALVLATLALLHRNGAPEGLQRAGRTLVAVLVGQAAVGYAQYFTGVPVLLVGVHIAGAVAVWVATLNLALRFTACAPAPADAPARRDREAVATA